MLKPNFCLPARPWAVFSLLPALTLLAFASVAGCAQFNAVVMQKPDATRLTGDWRGTYTCEQGLTGATLSISGTTTGEVTGIFEFHAVPENPRIPSGRYTMRGWFKPTGELVMTPGTWVSQPLGFRMVGLNGKVDILTRGFTGNVPECRKPFNLSKVSAQPTLAAQATAVPGAAAQTSPPPAAPPVRPVGAQASAESARPTALPQTGARPAQTASPANNGVVQTRPNLEPSSQGSKELPPEVKQALKDYEDAGESPEINQTVDLNADGKPDYIIAGTGGSLGQSWQVFMSGDKGYADVLTANSFDLEVDTKSTKGVKNIILQGNVWTWNGQRYELPKRKSKK